MMDRGAGSGQGRAETPRPKKTKRIQNETTQIKERKQTSGQSRDVYGETRATAQTIYIVIHPWGSTSDHNDKQFAAPPPWLQPKIGEGFELLLLSAQL